MKFLTAENLHNICFVNNLLFITSKATENKNKKVNILIEKSLHSKKNL